MRELDLLERVRRTVARSLEPVDGRKLLVALSGGADSSCLVHVLAAIAPESVAGACHVNHGLRPGADDEVAHVAAMCDKLRLDLVVRRVDTPELMARERLSAEVAARRLRYEALRTVAEEMGADFIALGHTADDQVETILMHEFRGSGLSGLVGMRTIVGDLVRPLLQIDHATAVEYCRVNGLQVTHDPSNDDGTILRNRMRHEVLPAVETAFPGARQAVLALASTAARDAGYLEAQAREALHYVVREGRVIPELWASLPESLQYHVLRQLAIDRKDTLTAQALEDKAARLRSHLRPRSAWADETFRLFDAGKAVSVSLRLPGRTAVDGVTFDALLVPGGATLIERLAASSPSHALIDAEATGRELTVRTWRPGDRIHPLGSAGSRKLQDVFVDRKVSREMRTRIPLVEAGGRIVWVVGIALDDEVGVSGRTTWAIDVIAR